LTNLKNGFSAIHNYTTTGLEIKSFGFINSFTNQKIEVFYIFAINWVLVCGEFINYSYKFRLISI
tara:strand:- start:675 stop:869 length:195 start_codon:yes stop_codon:yes gene_type:complete